jgi:outer membrane protein assembly factor BamB
VFHGKGLAALDSGDGKELWNTVWETPYDVNATTPLVDGARIFITSGYGVGCELLKADRSGVAIVWRNKTIASHHSDPFIIGGHLYGYSGQSMQNRGSFKCVELETGAEKWVTGEMGWGTCVYVDGHLLCCDIKGNLTLMKPDPSEFIKAAGMPRALGDIRGPVWTVPVLANGKLYLRFKQTLMCYEFSSENDA